MSLISAFALFTSLACVVSLTILPPFQSTAAGLLQSPVAPGKFENDPPSPANVSSGSSKILKIQCDGEKYGKNLNIASCSNIFNYIDKRVQERTFADRNTGIQADILLPWRIYDSVYLSVQLCHIAARSAVMGIGCVTHKLIQGRQGALLRAASSQTRDPLSSCKYSRNWRGCLYTIERVRNQARYRRRCGPNRYVNVL